MNTVILEVRSLTDTLADAARAMKSGRAEREVRIGFATPELLWQVLTAKRWELLKAMCGAGAMSIREAARRVGRDVKAVHGDVVALLDAQGRTGLPTRTCNIRLPLRGTCCVSVASDVNARNNIRGNLHFMNQISVADILELPVQERIQLVEVIWESIAAFPNAIEVSPELKTELEARLADFERNPEAGYSWDQVKAHLNSGSWRTA